MVDEVINVLIYAMHGNYKNMQEIELSSDGNSQREISSFLKRISWIIKD